MELGEKLKRCRLEAGLSQRQLCEGIVTRNMLSLMEHGTAKPSMDTLQALARRLNKPVSYFLEEESPLEEARKAYCSGDLTAAATQLSQCDPSLPEVQLLSQLVRLDRGEEAIRQGRHGLALELLGAPVQCPYLEEELERRRLLLLSQVPGQDTAALVEALPSLDRELMLRAQAAPDPYRAATLLDAVQDHGTLEWCLLRAKTHMALGEYRLAASLMEPLDCREAYPMLEICYRELGDFQNAYRYACKVRE